MKMTRREFLGTAGALAGMAALNIDVIEAKGDSMSPAINPVYLTGSMDHWPLAKLAQAGYKGLELIPACLDRIPQWKSAAEKAGLRPLCVNALPELRPYLTGSLSDAVAWRRRDTLHRLLKALEVMRKEEIPFLVVAPSRLAENYQSVEQARALLVESLKDLAGAGETTVLLEAAPFRMYASSSEIAKIVDEVGLPNVGAALDVGHALLAGESPATAASVLGQRLRYVQVHDADVRPGMPRLDHHLPLGTGSAKKEEVKAAVGKLPFAVGVTAPDEPFSVARKALEWLTG